MLATVWMRFVKGLQITSLTFGDDAASKVPVQAWGAEFRSRAGGGGCHIKSEVPPSNPFAGY